MTAKMTAKISIGVFVPNGAQLLDIASVDVLGAMSKEYLSIMPGLPKALVDNAPSVSISYITTPTLAGEAAVPLTADMVLRPSHSYEDAAVAPGQLDLVVVPGPDPASRFEVGALAWLRSQAEAPGVDVLCVCTGIYVCAAAGIANGRQASGPRGLQDDLRSKFPEVRLVGDDHRWVRDGNFWSSGEFESEEEEKACPVALSTLRWDRADGEANEFGRVHRFSGGITNGTT